MSIAIEEAISLALAYTTVLPEAQIPLLEALGRVLARQVCAPMAQPPFDRSPLDGYALRAADTADASPERPAVLQVVDKLYAGQVPGVPIGPGQAVRLMTGAMIPAGADCVIRQEDTDLGENAVQIFCGVPSGGNYCGRGEEYGRGDKLLSAGEKVDAAALAVASAAGIRVLPVYGPARAAVISTGDEICEPGQPLPPGKIYDSNTAYLMARLGKLGVSVTRTLYAGDDVSHIVETLSRCAGCDLILTTGGVSVGQKDLLEAAAEEFGARILFHGIDMKPGMPTLLAKRGNTLLLGLSGNPFSAAVPFELLLRPMLAKMVCDGSLTPRRITAAAAGDFGKESPLRRFLRAYCDGTTVSIPKAQSNAQMRSMIGCNCLVDIPAGSGVVHQGDQVGVLLL